MFGAESATRPDSLQRAGALGLRHQLLVRFGKDIETLDDEALGDELSDGKGTHGMLSNDIKDKMSAGYVHDAGLFLPHNLILSHGVRSHVHTSKSASCNATGSMFRVHLPVAFGELRLTGREKRNWKKSIWMAVRVRGTCREYLS